MLWTILTLISSFMFCGVPLVAARREGAAPAEFALAVTVALLLAVGNAWILYKGADTLAHRPAQYSEAAQEWFFGGLYAVATLWIPIAGFFGPPPNVHDNPPDRLTGTEIELKNFAMQATADDVWLRL